MAIQVEVPYRKTVETAGSPHNVYEKLANLKTSVPGAFPGIERLQDEGNGQYRWLFQKIGYSQYEFQIQLLTRVTMNRPESIRLTPVPGPGLSQLEGGWKIQPSKDPNRSLVELDFRLVLELPLSSFLKAMAAPIAQKELLKLFDRYATNVAKTHFA